MTVQLNEQALVENQAAQIEKLRKDSCTAERFQLIFKEAAPDSNEFRWNYPWKQINTGESLPGGAKFRIQNVETQECIILKSTITDGMADCDKSKFEEYFLSEVKVARNLAYNPNSRELILDGRTKERALYAVYADPESISLSDLMQAARFSIPAATSVAVQMLNFLSDVHKLGETQWCVCPKYIAITRDGTVLMDHIASPPIQAGTRIMHQLPHANYLSPEVAMWGAVPTPASLIYSVGVILYELFTHGKRPSISGQPTLPSKLNPDIPTRFDQVVLKALAKDSAQRYQSADEFLMDLMSCYLQTINQRGPGRFMSCFTNTTGKFHKWFKQYF